MKRAAEHIKGVVIDTHPHPKLEWVTVVCTLKMPDPSPEFTRIHIVDLPERRLPVGCILEAMIVCMGDDTFMKGLEGGECIALEWSATDEEGDAISHSDGWQGYVTANMMPLAGEGTVAG